MKQLLASPSLQLVTYPASATAQSAEFASADCVTGLNEIGQISVSNISGDPQDVERIVALKADEQGASWYRIITMYEDQLSGCWSSYMVIMRHGTALLPCTKTSSLITGAYRQYCMHECHLQQMNNAGCGASALSGL